MNVTRKCGISKRNVLRRPFSIRNKEIKWAASSRILTSKSMKSIKILASRCRSSSSKNRWRGSTERKASSWATRRRTCKGSWWSTCRRRNRKLMMKSMETAAWRALTSISMITIINPWPSELTVIGRMVALFRWIRRIRRLPERSRKWSTARRDRRLLENNQSVSA